MTTTPAVTAIFGIVGATCHLDLANAPEMTAEDGRTFTPTKAVFAANVYGFSGETIHYTAYLAASHAASEPCIYYTNRDEVPDWLPLPPDGWDLGVTIAAERAALEAEEAAA